jgi:hypothetical protein
MKSVIVGETTAGGGGYVNVKVSPSGALTMESEQSDPDNLHMTELNSGDILAEIQDNLQDYFLGGFETIGDVDYVAYEDKAGAYYVMKVDSSSGIVTYAVGTGGEPGPTNYAALDYGAFNAKF